MNDNTLKIKSALYKATDTVKEVYKIIGSEIKTKRLLLAKTLSAVSSDVCSISYLCKIENSKIIPNRIYLREICKKLEMQNSKIDALMNLKSSIATCVKAYLNNEPDKIKEKYLDGKSLINYRYKIVEFIYYISIKDLNMANKKVEALVKICSNMTKNDLIIFSTFYGILSFYNQEYSDALASFEYAINFYTDTNVDALVLAMKYKFYTYTLQNSSCTMLVYNKLINLIVENGYLQMLDEIHYRMSIFLLKNRNLLEYKKVFKLVKNTTYKNSLYLLAKLILNPYLRIKPSWIENVEPMFYYLGLIKVDLNRAKQEILKLKPTSFSETFDPTYLQYSILESDEERLFFINNAVLPMLDKDKKTVVADFFLSELACICKRINRYKMFVDLYIKLKGKRI